MTDRIQAIQSMLAKNPKDVFLHYSLGMEQAAAGDQAGAVESFRRCIQLDDGYLPAYVEAGKTLRACKDYAAAREVFAAGMELAAVQGETHMRDFIQQQLDGLPTLA